MGKLKAAVGLLLLLCGVGVFLYPTWHTWLLDRQTEEVIREFEGRTEIQYADTKDEETAESKNKETDPLYQECVTYNQKIYAEGQSNLTDAWSYEQPAVSIDGLEGNVFGYVEIPAMGAKLALYLGASEKNLEQGVAVMGQTSLPIGGKDTNCVIAGHRGYYGSPYFKEIENLSVGDCVYITNPWETLVYRVVSIDIIEPYDIDAVCVQEGRDMVTLLTCHPYAANTVEKKRYVVYCERDPDASYEVREVINHMDDAESKEQITASNGQTYPSSKEKIRREEMLRNAAAALLMVMAAALAVYRWRQGRKERKL